MAKTVKIKNIKGENRPIVDIGTQLQMEIEGMSSRFKTTLIGMDSGKCLLVKAPNVAMDENPANIWTKGDNINVRYLYNGSVLGFQSKLIDSISSPIPLLFIEYPDAVENVDLRSKIRIQCFLPTKSQIQGELNHGVILDMSEGGCKYQIKAFNGKKLPSVSIDETIKLLCRFPGIRGESEIIGKIRNIAQDNMKKVFGIQFTEFVDPESKSILSEYVTSAKSFL